MNLFPSSPIPSSPLPSSPFPSHPFLSLSFPSLPSSHLPSLPSLPLRSPPLPSPPLLSLPSLPPGGNEDKYLFMSEVIHLLTYFRLLLKNSLINPYLAAATIPFSSIFNFTMPSPLHLPDFPSIFSDQYSISSQTKQYFILPFNSATGLDFFSLADREACAYRHNQGSNK